MVEEKKVNVDIQAGPGLFLVWYTSNSIKPLKVVPEVENSQPQNLNIRSKSMSIIMHTSYHIGFILLILRKLYL